MSIQVIVYSKTSGRVIGVVDPTPIVPPNAIAYLSSVGPLASYEAKIVYNKKGGNQDTLESWQTAVNAVTGLNVQVGVPNSDRFCIIDSNNNIVGVTYAAPEYAATNPFGGYGMIAHNTADQTWTFAPPGTFTPPVAAAAPVKG